MMILHDALFQWVMAASLRASLMAAAVLAVQFALRRWLPARWRYALWLPVALVLVAPALPSSPWSMENGIVVTSAAATTPPPTVVMPVISRAAVTSPEVPLSNRWTPSGREWLAAAWLAGTIAALAAGILGFRQSMRRVEQGQVETGDDITALVGIEATAIGVRRKPRIVVSRAVSSPAVAGLLRPVLLLPIDFTAKFTAQEARLIVRHELIHIKRCDLLSNTFLCVIQALHWFNPVLWFAFNRIRQDRETACDALVLASENDDAPFIYGHALLKAQHTGGHAGLSLGFVGLLERGSGMRSRIQAIATHRKPHSAWAVAVAAIVALLTMVGATRAETKTNAPDSAPEIKIRAIFIQQMSSFQLEAETMTSINGMSVFIVSSEQLKTLFKSLKDTYVSTAPELVVKDGQTGITAITPQNRLPKGSEKTIVEPVGITLKVTPSISGEKALNLDITASVSREKRKEAGKDVAGSDPSQDEFKAQVTVPKGSSVVLFKGATEGKRHWVAVVNARILSTYEKVVGKIILPSVNFKDITLEECIAQITALAAKNDPQGKGIDIVARMSKDEAARKITFSFSDIPADKAMEWVAAMGGVELEWSGDKAILQTPRNPLQPMEELTPAKTLSNIQKRASSIIVPTYAADNLTLPDAVKSLEEECLRADPEKKGIRITLDPSIAVDPNVKLTFSLTNVTVQVAAETIAKLGNVELVWSDSQLSFTSPKGK